MMQALQPSVWRATVQDARRATMQAVAQSRPARRSTACLMRLVPDPCVPVLPSCQAADDDQGSNRKNCSGMFGDQVANTFHGVARTKPTRIAAPLLASLRSRSKFCSGLCRVRPRAWPMLLASAICSTTGSGTIGRHGPLWPPPCGPGTIPGQRRGVVPTPAPPGRTACASMAKSLISAQMTSCRNRSNIPWSGCCAS